MDKILLNLGPLNITWYAFLITSSVVLSYIIINKNKNIKIYLKNNQDFIINYYIGLIITALIGARLWYVVFYGNYYIEHPFEILAINKGGLAIHGGIIAGILYTIYYSKKNKTSSLILMDAMVPGLMLGQVIGRFGNFINQEAHGPQTTYEFLKNTLHLPDFIVNGMYINGIYYQPTFLYESIGNFIGLIILLVLMKYKKISSISFYLIWYGILRLLIEMLRTDALMFYGIKVAQVTSIVMIVSGLIMIGYKIHRNKKV